MAQLSTAWATRADLPPIPDEVNVSADEQDLYLLIASGVLFQLTGRKWPGIVSDTVRPQRTGCGCLSQHGRSGCHWISEVKLPGHPVLAVQEVLLDGDLVSEDRYRVDDGQFLVYLPASDADEVRGWPCCQRNDRDVTEDETWQVTYTWGGIPDVGGVKAAAVLALELMKAQFPKSGCRLPQRVQSVSRQGVSYVMLDPLDLFDKGRTGLVEVDLWLAAHVIGKTRRRSAFVDPHSVAMNGRRVRRRDTNPSS